MFLNTEVLDTPMNDNISSPQPRRLATFLSVKLLGQQLLAKALVQNSYIRTVSFLSLIKRGLGISDHWTAMCQVMSRCNQIWWNGSMRPMAEIRTNTFWLWITSRSYSLHQICGHFFFKAIMQPISLLDCFSTLETNDITGTLQVYWDVSQHSNLIKWTAPYNLL